MKHAVFFDGFFFSKSEEFKACEKDGFTKLLFCKFIEKRKTKKKEKTQRNIHSSLLEGPTSKEHNFRSKKQLQKETCFSKNIAFFVKKGMYEKGNFFLKKTEFIVEKKKEKRFAKKGRDFSRRSFSLHPKKSLKRQKSRWKKKRRKKRREKNPRGKHKQERIKKRKQEKRMKKGIHKRGV